MTKLKAVYQDIEKELKQLKDSIESAENELKDRKGFTELTRETIDSLTKTLWSIRRINSNVGQQVSFLMAGLESERKAMAELGRSPRHFGARNGAPQDAIVDIEKLPKPSDARIAALYDAKFPACAEAIMAAQKAGNFGLLFAARVVKLTYLLYMSEAARKYQKRNTTTMVGCTTYIIAKLFREEMTQAAISKIYDTAESQIRLYYEKIAWDLGFIVKKKGKYSVTINLSNQNAHLLERELWG